MTESLRSEDLVGSEGVTSPSEPETLQSLEIIKRNEIAASAEYERRKDSLLTKVALTLIGAITITAAASVLWIGESYGAAEWGFDTLRLVLVGALSFVWGASSSRSNN